MKKIAYVAIIAVIVVLCGYAIKVASERDKMIAEEWKQHEIRAISKDSCMPKRDLVLKKYFGKISEKHSIIIRVQMKKIGLLICFALSINIFAAI